MQIKNWIETLFSTADPYLHHDRRSFTITATLPLYHHHHQKLSLFLCGAGIVVVWW
jgi:hypothetical protein